MAYFVGHPVYHAAKFSSAKFQPTIDAVVDEWRKCLCLRVAVHDGTLHTTFDVSNSANCNFTGFVQTGNNI